MIQEKLTTIGSVPVPPKPVGRWIIPDVILHYQGTGANIDVVRKPNWFRVKLISLLLGWKYESFKD